MRAKGAIVLVFGILVAVLFAGCADELERTRQALSKNNLRQLALAMRAFEAKNNAFPPAAGGEGENRGLSWRVLILRELGCSDLYAAFHLDEPWDSPHNKTLVDAIPDVYMHPAGPRDGTTCAMVFTGPGTLFDWENRPQGRSWYTQRDRQSDTILIVEAGLGKAVPWTKPEDLPFVPEDPISALGDISGKYGFNASFVDTHTIAVRPDVEPELLKAAITCDGGESFDVEDLRMR